MKFTKINRRAVKRAALLSAGGFLLISLGFGYVKWQWDRTVVTIVNGSGQAVDDVEIGLDSGGRYALGLLLPGQSRDVRIFPNGEAAMRLRFQSGPDYTKRTSPETYVESSGGYRPRLTIDRNDVVRCDYGSRLGFLLF